MPRKPDGERAMTATERVHRFRERQRIARQDASKPAGDAPKARAKGKPKAKGAPKARRQPKAKARPSAPESIRDAPKARARPGTKARPGSKARLKVRAKASRLGASGALEIDDKTLRYIKARLHPDTATDPVERQKLEAAFKAIMSLPITTITKAERERRERDDQVFEQKRREGEAIYRKRQAAARRGQETRRRNAEAEAQRRSRP